MGALEGVVVGVGLTGKMEVTSKKSSPKQGPKLGEAPTASSHARWIPRVMDSGGVGLRGWCPSKNQ